MPKKNLVNKHKQVGMGQTPPLVWEKFPLNPVFFSEGVPNFDLKCLFQPHTAFPQHPHSNGSIIMTLTKTLKLV